MIQVLEYTFNTRKSIDIHTYINGFEYNKHAYKLQWYLWNVHFHKCFYIYGYIWRNCSSHKESLTTLKVFWSHNTFGLVVCSNGVSNFPLEKWGETNLFFNATERADVMLLLLAEWYEKKLTVFCFFFLNSQANYFQHLCNYIYNMQIYHTSPLHREKNKSKNKQTNDAWRTTWVDKNTCKFGRLDDSIGSIDAVRFSYFPRVPGTMVPRQVFGTQRVNVSNLIKTIRKQ